MILVFGYVKIVKIFMSFELKSENVLKFGIFPTVQCLGYHFGAKTSPGFYGSKITRILRKILSLFCNTIRVKPVS